MGKILGDIKGKYVVISGDSSIGKGTVVWHFVNIYDSIIGENCKIASHVEIGGSKVGNHCKIEAFVSIPPGATIGNHVFIGPGVRFANDKYPSVDPVWNVGNITVKDHAKIGMGALILPGVVVGEYAFIAAGALIAKDVPPDTFAMGTGPAHHIHKSVFDKVEIL